MIRKRVVTVYSEDEKDAIRAQKDRPQARQRCPVCGALGIRRYYSMVEGRTRPAIASLAWCPGCHTYTGSTGPALGRVVTTDPVKEDPNAPKDSGSQAAMDEYLSFLDRLWDAGRLPQRIVHRNVGS